MNHHPFEKQQPPPLPPPQQQQPLHQHLPPNVSLQQHPPQAAQQHHQQQQQMHAIQQMHVMQQQHAHAQAEGADGEPNPAATDPAYAAAFYMNPMNGLTYNPYAAAAAVAMAHAYSRAPSGGAQPRVGPGVGAGGANGGTGAGSAMNGTQVSIWVGDLDPYMDERFLTNAVASAGWTEHVQRVKVIRRSSGAHAGYGFLVVHSMEAAQHIIQFGNGLPIAMTNRSWRLQMGRVSGGSGDDVGMDQMQQHGQHWNRAASGDAVAGDAAGRGGWQPATEANLYVGDLDPAVSDYELLNYFRARFASVRHAKVMCDEVGQSRGYGFIRFSSMADAQEAVKLFNGTMIRGRPIRVNLAHRSSGGQSNDSRGGGGGNVNGGTHPNGPKRRRDQGSVPSGVTDESITTLFVGGTIPSIQEGTLWEEFSAHGTVQAVKLPISKTGFAFVRFATRADAESAKNALNMSSVPSINPHRAIRVEWAAEQLPVRDTSAASDGASMVVDQSQQSQQQQAQSQLSPQQEHSPQTDSTEDATHTKTNGDAVLIEE
ncbi:Polyadenylate-binding protein RBP47C' [Porphyridium purpureum]|uniref:Polyadenylate-binding protein RBP47C n=1 Tax=Porphyridium purpureum TaxID=35688 RepID=A0A5J4YRZ5_PORPP|nr:Polyadenylate-binding protein RBP47C' [Porphyridium purpureum]|eukprot:POR1909..scf236_6